MEIDLSQVPEEHLDEVQSLLSRVADEYKYNKMLQTALDRMYPWQKKAISNTATHKVTGIIMPQTHPTCLLYTSPSPRDS